MSARLLEQIYRQVKRVVSKPLALSDEHGSIYREYADLSLKKSFTLTSPSREKLSQPIAGNENLQAIPVYYDDKFLVFIVIEAVPDDSQTIQVVASLAELIVQQFVLEHRPRPDAVDLLLTRLAYKSSSIDLDELEHSMAALGYALNLQRVALSIELKGFWEHYLQGLGSPVSERENLIEAKKRDIDQSLSSFFTKNPDNVVGFIGNDTFLVLKDLRDSDYEHFCTMFGRHYNEIASSLKNFHITEVTVGIGSSATSPSGLFRSVAEALQVMDIGKKIIGSNRALRLLDLGILPLVTVGNESQKKDYAERILNVLNEAGLVETLRAFLKANLSLTKTAEDLKIHRNTAIYRLDKISQILGRDPREFDMAVELHLALLFDKLYR